MKNAYISEQPSVIAEELDKESENVKYDDNKNKIENYSNY